MLNATAAEVFGTITKGEGWSSLGLSLLVSQGAIMFLIVGKSYIFSLICFAQR